MNKEKQIKELGEEIYQHCSAGLFEDEANAIAEFVINKQGYRKANDLVEEIFEEIEILLRLNSLQGDIFIGKYFDVELEAEIAELKKKYTEGEG